MKLWNVTWKGSVYRYYHFVTDDGAKPTDAVEFAETHRLEFLEGVSDMDAEDWEVLSVKEVKFK
jgi:hypothetical protein